MRRKVGNPPIRADIGAGKIPHPLLENADRLLFLGHLPAGQHLFVEHGNSRVRPFRCDSVRVERDLQHPVALVAEEIERLVGDMTSTPQPVCRA